MDDSVSTEEWLKRIGLALKQRRIALQIEQEQLATRIGISRGAVVNLENGHGCTLRTLIPVFIALELQDSLAALAPKPLFDQLELDGSSDQAPPRVRAFKPRAAKRNPD
jgi:DNA-binding XRE family transcriptional regulator